MTINEMRERKREYGYTCETIAMLSGVPLGTVQKIFSGETESPRQETIEKLIKVLSPEKNEYSVQNWGSADCFGEAAPKYNVKKQGDYNLEDYYSWPDDQRVELINGYIYDMGSPYNFHQLVVGEIFRQISNYIHDNNGPCIPLLSPIDVQLDKDEFTMVQPDVGILCDRSKFQEKCIIGAPDFVVEIISPSSSKKDQVIKLEKYMTAGVREYWIVDFKTRQVFVYFFESDELVKMYPIGSPIPVNIYNGDLVIDFSEIKEYIDKYAPEIINN